jgi:hypothetical protein
MRLAYHYVFSDIVTTSQNIVFQSQPTVISWTEREDPVKDFRIVIGDTEQVFVVKILGQEPSWFQSAFFEMESLLNLPDNWNPYGSRRINPMAAFRGLDLLFKIMRAQMPEPSIVPTADGSIQLEWHTLKADLEIRLLSYGSLSFLFEDCESGEVVEIGSTTDLKQVKAVAQRL